MSEVITPERHPEKYREVQLGPRSVTFPEDWEINTVDNLFEIQKTPFDPSERERGSKVLLYSMPAYDSGREPEKTRVEEIGSKKYEVPQDTILFPKLNIRKRRFWRVRHDHDYPAICSTEYWPLLPKKELSLAFYNYYFDSYRFMSDPKVTSSSSTNSHKRVKEQSFTKLQLPVPPLEEQRHIADILAKIDKQIQQTDRIIQETQGLRAGLLQDLFHNGYGEHEEILAAEDLGAQSGGVSTGMDQTTVGDIPADWDTERLGELSESSSYGLNASAEEFSEAKLRYLRITDISEEGHLKDDDPTSISPKKAEGYEIEPGDIMFARTGATVGKTFLYRDYHPDAAYAGYLIRFKFDESRVLPEFVFYYTQTDNYSRWVARITRQGAQENINTSEYSSILLPLPPIDEQQKIVSTLQTVDEQIKEERETKQELQALKRSLMQDLLTGKVRVDMVE
ncbi:restriction endonuclease subunit S [Halobacterium sp. KA-4]|uniref:restriction endonuclease subunit S n=1 Tax=Halobacterium sp. KA-4 TaxID=2896367 RepID=UPI001E394C98|nr:restriction endonuclease subunit S [Halobacterium sp. KA-4]MCD2200797.1 restriction endonuclease subunit S [Halobacterium sp. KA-4]